MPLDLGKLLRLHAMAQASQVEVTREAGRAMFLAYTFIVAEIGNMLTEAGETELRDECMRLFSPMEDVPSAAAGNAQVQLARATEGLVRLRQVTGWLQGLIEHATLDRRMRLEAQEKAALEAKRTGF